jgi:hypothetical protein
MSVVEFCSALWTEDIEKVEQFLGKYNINSQEDELGCVRLLNIDLFSG